FFPKLLEFLKFRQEENLGLGAPPLKSLPASTRWNHTKIKFPRCNGSAYNFVRADLWFPDGSRGPRTGAIWRLSSVKRGGPAPRVSLHGAGETQPRSRNSLRPITDALCAGRVNRRRVVSPSQNHPSGGVHRPGSGYSTTARDRGA